MRVIRKLDHPDQINVQALLEQICKGMNAASAAYLLGVSPAMVSRWRKGEEISPPMRRRIIDAYAVLARALQIFMPQVVLDWLDGSEPTYAGARPVDILHAHGAAPLLAILDRQEDLAYA